MDKEEFIKRLEQEGRYDTPLILQYAGWLEKESAKLNILQRNFTTRSGWQAVPFPGSGAITRTGKGSGPIKWTTLGILKSRALGPCFILQQPLD